MKVCLRVTGERAKREREHERGEEWERAREAGAQTWLTSDADVRVDVKNVQEDLLPHMGILTDSARRIGAVNTITARLAADGSRILVGDNTDWVAIHRLVEQVWCCSAPLCCILHVAETRRALRAALSGSAGEDVRRELAKCQELWWGMGR